MSCLNVVFVLLTDEILLAFSVHLIYALDLHRV